MTQTLQKQILVAGIGNAWLRDDGFGGEVVKRLEGSNLTLEESLDAFDEGIRLVSRGEKLLTAAEKRVEQLLASEHGDDRLAPLDVAAQGGRLAPGFERSAEARPQADEVRSPPAIDPAEEDIPF